ncbi:MAG: magnesium/cobalt transporter CorA [Candidatus Aenigmarchaeota archaeon]|nr:magnesium/cobalt transporter CorA [Candidatus Aenigmarchaeota archaeon]
MLASIFYADKGKVKAGKPDQFGTLKKKQLWIDIQDPTKADMDFLRKHFRFHKLALEDCIHAIQRSKIDDYKSFYFMAMHAIAYRNGKLAVQEIDFFLGETYVITVHQGNVACVDAVRERLGHNGILQRGADFTLYVMLDIMVDNLFPVTDVINERLDSIENEIFKTPKKDVVSRLFHLRRDILTLRRYIGPEREVLNALTRGDAKFVDAGTIPYLRDIYDHLYRIAESIDISRDIIISSFEAYLSTISNRLNETMKTLTIIATIILPMSLVASIYGMNFRFMPELTWEYGYPFALGVMLLIAAVMLLYFRRKGWL